MSLEGPDLPEPRKTNHRWLDFVISFCALFMSAVSVFMAYHTSHSMENLVHANSWPFAQMDSGNVDELRNVPLLAFTLKNAGTGPARLHSFEFLYEGEPVTDGFVWDRIAQECCASEREQMIAAAAGDTLAAYGAITTNFAAPGFLSPSEEISVLTWPRTEMNKTLWHAMDQARQTGRITTRSCYCSVFDECWIAETHVFPPQPVAACTETPPAQRH